MSQPSSGSGITTRIATRFALVYFLLYAGGSQIFENLLTFPGGESVGRHSWSRLLSWVGVHVFGWPGVNTATGSLDRVFDWLQLLTFATLAIAASAVWMIWDRRRASDAARGSSEARIDAWLRVVLRISLGSVLAFYGGIKLWPVQMPAPSLTQLFQPIGWLTPQDLMWVWVGAAHPYEVFLGVLEVGTALLLFVPRTASLGAVLAVLELGYILVLDLAYDLPVKLWVCHLLIMATILAAPIVPALWDVLFHRAPRVPAAPAPLFASARLARMAVLCQLILGGYVVGVNVMNAQLEWRDRDQIRSASAPLYGAWRTVGVAEWRRLIFERGRAFLQRPDDTYADYEATIDRGGGTVTLTRPSDPAASGLLRFVLTDGDGLMLDGRIDGRTVHLELQRIDAAQLPLVSRRFHLIQEFRTAK